jgi:hypothetical protein
MSDMLSGRMSAPAYFGAVALVTVLGLGAAAVLHPGFLHGTLQSMGLEAAPQAAPDSFYAKRIAPLLESRCAGCHGANREKGQLRLDSFAAVMRGGKGGAVIKPGSAKDSEMFQRISLPASEDKAMPPSGKTPLTLDEVTVIRLWIANGASGKVRDIKGAPRPVREIKIPEIDPVALRKQRSPLAAALTQLQARFPGVIAYESRDSADLEVEASLKGPAFGDAELAALGPLQERIVRADLSGTAITDASAPTLAAMTSLRTLRLTNTKITGKTVQMLVGLKALKSLGVVGTSVRESVLTPLRQRGIAIYGDSDVR